MPRIDFGPFGIDAPAGWSLATLILAGPVEENPGVGTMLTAKPPPRFQQNLVATLEQVPPNETPESYVKRQLEGLKKAGVPRQDTAPPETVKLSSGREGLLVEQLVQGHDGARVRQLQLVSIKDGVAFTLIASHLDGVPYEKSRASFRQILLSFT